MFIRKISSFKSFSPIVISIAICTLFLSGPVTAQDQPDQSNDWEFTIAPYLLFPYMNGFVTMGGIESGVSVGPGDIFSNLNIGFMIFAEASNPDWAIIADALYMDLGQTGLTPLGREIQTDMSQLAVEVTGLRRISPVFELGLGFRINSLSGDLFVPEGQILPEIDISDKQTWVDPLITARLMAPLNYPLRFGVRGDIGGFGISSDFTWQFYPFFGYQFSKLFEMMFAYRWLGIDYSTGSGDELFKYDMTIFGPEIGFLFHL